MTLSILFNVTEYWVSEMNFLPEGIPLSKRMFDLVLTAAVMVLAVPLMAVISLLVWIKLGRPIFFRQERPGYRGAPFRVTKFRTMSDVDKRITALGHFLRSTSLDELPELVHVLRGQMSLVGPRPLLMQYLDRFTPEQARRHDVLPGITGWAQVNGRNILNWEDKFRLDVWYVDNRSLWLDVKILALTVWKVLNREGISQPGHVTSEEFMGSEEAQ
jgi:lipopolysaccharide/colanic/teichoic acid biosynthesis glycosyltransferase